MNRLPEDCASFLRAGKQLDFDPSGTSIGRIKLKSFAEIAPRTVSVFPNSPDIVDDPYASLDGQYFIELIDLVAESDDYIPTGLLCWLPVVGRFGSVDSEHGTILTFPSATWTAIAEAPIDYLDAQWGPPAVEIEYLLPWLYFGFKFSDVDLVLNPYSETCPIHGEKVVIGTGARPELYEVYRRRELEKWLNAYITEFPCAGVPVDEQQLKYCVRCHELENDWIARIEREITPIEATPNSAGWVLCPGCGIRFATYSAESFSGGIHLTCGQKIRVVE